MCVDINGKKAPHYHKELGTKNYGVDCQKSCENSYGCEAFAIHLEADAGQLWVTSCSLYGARVVPPHGFEYVAGDGKSEVVQGDFPGSGDNYPVRCFVRVPDTPVIGSVPSKQSVVADAGRPEELKVNLQLKDNREATASYLQLQGSVLTIQDSILEITGVRTLCAPADDECDIDNVVTGSQVKVLNRSTYVSPSGTVVQPRVVQVTCPDIPNRKTEVSCHADGTWHTAATCSQTTTDRSQSSSTDTFHIGSSGSAGTTVASHLQNTNSLVRDNLLIIIVSVTSFIAILLVTISVSTSLCRRRHVSVVPVQNLPHTSVELTESSHTNVGATTFNKVEYL